MAIPNTKDTLKEWCLRKLGKPVIEINVSDTQLDDRIDEALQFFQEYHFDGVEKVYEKYQITQADIDKKYISLSDFGGAADSYIGIIRIFPVINSSIGMWDIRYQMRLSDLTTFGTYLGGYDLLSYEMRMKNIQLISELLTGKIPVRFNRHKNILNIDWDWENDPKVGEYLIIEAYKILDPETYTDVYNDMFLKQYVTSLFKEQWGLNLSKFEGIQMPGGVTLNGRLILEDAKAEIEKLREEMSLRYELPLDMMMS